MISASLSSAHFSVYYNWQHAHVLCIYAFLRYLLFPLIGNYLTEWHRLINSWRSFFLPVVIAKRRSNRHVLSNQVMIVLAWNIPDNFNVCNPLNSNRVCVFQPYCKQGVKYIAWLQNWIYSFCWKWSVITDFT